VSQAGLVNIAGGGGGGSPIFTLTGNSGGAVPPTANNVFTVGTGSITVAGNPGTSTLTTQLTGLGNHSVLVGAGTATITSLAVGTNGQVLLGSTGANPVFNNLTSSDASITFTTGPGTLDLKVASGADVGKTITGNTGGPLSPTLGNWNIFGAGNIVTNGTGSTLTTELTGLTQYNVLLGQGTPSLGFAAPGTAGIPLISQGATSYPSFGTALVVGGGTGSTSFNTNGVVISGTSSTAALTALSLTDGQVVIGSSAGAPTAATLTAGAGITITNGHNSISIAANDFAFAYTNVAHVASPYTVLSTDEYISVDCSGGAVTLKFPNAPTANRTWVIKDRTGSASTYNISVTTVGGSVTIDGQTTYTIAGNYGAVQLLWNGVSYEIY
jgi:hypothetical protein